MHQPELLFCVEMQQLVYQVFELEVFLWNPSKSAFCVDNTVKDYADSFKISFRKPSLAVLSKSLWVILLCLMRARSIGEVLAKPSEHSFKHYIFACVIFESSLIHSIIFNLGVSS
ncbi:unnamed protein product [Moneuplotes crassus]|uniref:Uncharacterized protein n=1 Tax=Euplotes crassus TaxID=5936 RepID=A0AAD1XBM9_EUPCR|nr:unnamed protein product [Moneuplotes crassus]